MNLFSTDSEASGDILARAIETYEPSHIFGLFSGGRDSLAACHLASKLPGFSGCFHANTGIGIEMTRQFVRHTCASFGWSLVEIKASDLNPNDSYENFVREFGFPGPSMHSLIYNKIKERCVRHLVRTHKTHRKDSIMLVSGSCLFPGCAGPSRSGAWATTLRSSA